MNNMEILKMEDSYIFVMNLKSNSSRILKNEAIIRIKERIPYSFNENELHIIKCKPSHFYICILLKHKIKFNILLIPELWLMNHVKKDGYYTIDINNNKRIYQVSNGIVIDSFAEEHDNCICYNENDILNNYTKKDCLEINSHKSIVKKNITIISIFIAIALILSFSLQRTYTRIKIENTNKENTVIENKLKIEEQKSKQKKLNELNLEYKNLLDNQISNVYMQLSLLSSCIPNHSTIDNLSIEKDSFTIDITTTNSIKIISSFENCIGIYDVRMNKSTEIPNGEYVTFTGNFSRKPYPKYDTLSLDDKIIAYETSILEEKSKLSKKEAIALSEYVNSIKTFIDTNKCNLEYVQITTQNDIAVLEFFVNSNSNNLINLISTIQNYDILSLRIRNGNSLSKATIKLYSNINIKNDHNNEFNDNMNSTSPNSLYKYFYKEEQFKDNTNNKNINIIKEIKPISNHNYLFIGKSSVHGNEMVLLKNSLTGEVFKLPVNDERNINNDNFCIIENNVILATINNVIYEVNTK